MIDSLAILSISDHQSIFASFVLIHDELSLYLIRCENFFYQTPQFFACKLDINSDRYEIVEWSLLRINEQFNS